MFEACFKSTVALFTLQWTPIILFYNRSRKFSGVRPIQTNLGEKKAKSTIQTKILQFWVGLAPSGQIRRLPSGQKPDGWDQAFPGNVMGPVVRRTTLE
jgi:hypothetical protein